MALRLAVEGGGRLVEQQDGGVLQHGAGDGDALALTAGEVAAARADLGVVAAGEGGDEIMGAGHAGGLFDLGIRSEEHTSELQSLMRISYAVFCLKKTI